jgi:hypothetical protein
MIVILSTECSQSNSQTLPLAILGQKSLGRFKNTIMVQNTPHFCLQMTKGKQSIEKPQL